MQKLTVSSKHKLVAVPFEDNLASMFPAAQHMELGGETHLLIPHEPTPAFILRKLGFDVPSPILTSYDWPHPANNPPFEAQRNTAAMLTMNTRAYVLNGMGTGKTRAALWALDYLQSNKLCGKALVFAPLSTLTFVWQREVFTTIPGRKCVVLHGTREKRLEKLKEDADIYVVNHDGFGVIEEEVRKRTDIDIVIIDELAVSRNPTARTKRITKFRF